MSKSLLIKTLKLPKLLERWPDFSLENIYELADQGYFGLYIKPHRKVKNSYNIQKHIEDLIKKEPENEYYKELMECFNNFIANNLALIENKPGYARLPTSPESKIFPPCEISSIQFLNQHKKIDFYEFNNILGIVKLNGRCVCNSFLLRATTLTNKYPNGYKGSFSEEDIFVFVDQIENFEDLTTTGDDEKNEESALIDNHEGKLLDGSISSPLGNKELSSHLSLEHHPIPNTIKNLRGQHHGDKREQALTYAIAVILNDKNIKGTQAIANKVEKNIKGKTITNEKMVREFNRYLKTSLDFSNRHNNHEKLLGIILSVTYRLKLQLSDEDKFIELVTKESNQIANQLGISSFFDEIMGILKSIETLSIIQ